MHIVIIGGGDVGRELAQNLAHKQQKIAVVEKDREIAEQLGEELDVAVIIGNGANLDILNKAKIKNAEMLIAVTGSDEVNIIACMIAKKLEVSFTVARVRDPESAGSIDVDTRGLIHKQVGIDMIISPEKAVAQEIAKTINFPEAVEVEYFARGKAMMVATTVTSEARLVDQTLQELPLPKGCIVVGIKRPDGGFALPGGRDKIQVGDKVYLIGKTDVMRKASQLLHHESRRIKRVIILGGGVIGYSLASILESDKQNSFLVKIIEKDAERVQELNRKLSRTTVLQGDGTEVSYFNEEEIAEADILVAATEDDRTNIVASIMGQKLGVHKIISELTRISYASTYETVGVEETINPHLITAAQILRFTRREDVVSLSLLKEEAAEVMEVILPESACVVGQRIAEADFPRGLLIGTIVRGDEVIVPDGDTVLKAGDHLIIFAIACFRLDRFFACPKD
ncbi:Trk system potassium transporter TrkA [Desulfonatronospira sp. MSAO_Bac3]|uniref:Trk system potassium transporter TrkA n=1 Tax=Desulfonatronospira sp. MSAO_Bac3 TaxID=2293857 RepID=UPI000FF62E83|nr:Trk system potassium transporter TrkA [Desulfonatronospira sp. MSAO_Bac3]RQD76172.1 MAG: Trk system potassium transporter TrkA [Desulfonatronospira sp. MSAO_Bac3]